MAIREVIEQTVGIRAAVGGKSSLGSEIVRVIGQGVVAGGLAVGICGLREAFVEHVGVAEGKVRGGGPVAGVRLGIGEDAVVGSGGAG